MIKSPQFRRPEACFKHELANSALNHANYIPLNSVLMVYEAPPIRRHSCDSHLLTTAEDLYAIYGNRECGDGVYYDPYNFLEICG